MAPEPAREVREVPAGVGVDIWSLTRPSRWPPFLGRRWFSPPAIALGPRDRQVADHESGFNMLLTAPCSVLIGVIGRFGMEVFCSGPTALLEVIEWVK